MTQYALVLIAYFTLHSLLAAEGVKAILERCCLPRRWYRLVYNLIALAGLVVLYFLYRDVEAEAIGPAWLRSAPAEAVGVVVLAAGIGVVLLAFSQYDKAEFFGLRQWQQSGEESPPPLVTSGLNGRVRHPLYFGTFLVLWGWFVSSPTNAVLLSAIIGSAYLWIGARLEEAKLVRLYGDAYRRYQRSVPMLLPRIFHHTRGR